MDRLSYKNTRGHGWRCYNVNRYGGIVVVMIVSQRCDYVVTKGWTSRKVPLVTVKSVQW